MPKIPAPKNGYFYEVVLVGGHPQHQRDLLKTWEDDWRITVKPKSQKAKHHYEEHTSVPKKMPDCDFLVILTNFVGHPEAIPIRRRAKDAGIPTIFTSTKVSWASTFGQRGLKTYPSGIGVMRACMATDAKEQAKAEQARLDALAQAMVEKETIRRRAELLDKAVEGELPPVNLPETEEGCLMALAHVRRCIDNGTAGGMTDAMVEAKKILTDYE